MSGAQGSPAGPAKPGRYQRSVSGLIGAMVILVVGVVVVVVLRNVFSNDPEPSLPPVDYKPVQARAQDAGLEAPAPSSLPTGWKATSVSFTPPDPKVSGASGRWHLGLLTDQTRYVGLEETPSDVSKLVPDVIQDPTRGGLVRADGRTWRSWTNSDGGYVLTTPGDDGRSLLVGSPAGRLTVRTVLDRLDLG